MRPFGSSRSMMIANFNPRTPCGVRPCWHLNEYSQKNFNPRTPCGVRLYCKHCRRETIVFQSTHPLRGATIWTLHNCTPAGISIHAPLAGCDSRACRSSTTAFYFNPRTPCGVRRDADGRAPDCRAISIHAPLAGCDTDMLDEAEIRKISIHAPLAGCDER